jgi:hypothetical protein
VAWPAAPAAPAPATRAVATPVPTAAAPADAGPAQGEAAGPAAEAVEEPADPEPAADSAPAALAVLRLEAITARGGQPVAVISGQVVQVGDRIGASTVVRIGVAEVEIETSGLRRILRF